MEIPGPSKVYFQEPPEDKMEYPCIIYHVDREDAKHADNKTYNRTVGYQVTVIDRKPNSDIPALIVDKFAMTAFQRFFIADGLNHWVYTTFY